MFTLTFEDIKTITNKLFIENDFDQFLFVKGSIHTSITTEFNGQINPAFFDKEELEQIQDSYLPWSMVKPLYFQAIKGKRLPLSFSIVMALPKSQIERLILSHNLPFSMNDIGGLFLNFHYENKKLSITNGTSLLIFTPDKSLEYLWDSTLSNFFKKIKCS